MRASLWGSPQIHVRITSGCDSVERLTPAVARKEQSRTSDALSGFAATPLSRCRLTAGLDTGRQRLVPLQRRRARLGLGRRLGSLGASGGRGHRDIHLERNATDIVRGQPILFLAAKVLEHEWCVAVEGIE